MHNDVNISTHFFKKHASLSKTYIDKSIYYIDLYEKMIGKFPYQTFSVIESEKQVGYSMPTYTVIGDKIIDKPFLVDISLGHEILHQWFGDSIFNDFDKGNWVEGMTSYLADHYYRELKNEGPVHRRNILHDYSLFVNEKTPTLQHFKQRTDRASMLVGYGRGANVFHTIRKELGDELFFKSLKEFYQKFKFQYATFEDIKNHFGVDFDFLLNFKELIDVNISDIESFYDNGFKLSFKINTNSNLTLPILAGDEDFDIKIDKGSSKITLPLKQRAYELIIDKDYNLFRKLIASEKPVSLATVFEDNASLIVGSDERFQQIFKNARGVSKDKLTFEDTKKNNIIFCQDSLDLAKKFMPNLEYSKSGVTFTAIKNPWNENKIALFIYMENQNEF